MILLQFESFLILLFSTQLSTVDAHLFTIVNNCYTILLEVFYDNSIFFLFIADEEPRDYHLSELCGQLSAVVAAKPGERANPLLGE